MHQEVEFFPSKHGCSLYYSPQEILHGRKLNCEHECKIPQLSYVLIHDEPKPTNSMKPQALDGIYCRMHKVLHLATNEVIVCWNLTVALITEAVIQADKDDVFSFKHGVSLYNSLPAGVD
jgi:hypothetical protein